MLTVGGGEMISDFTNRDPIVGRNFFRQSGELHRRFSDQHLNIYEVSFNTSLKSAIQTLRFFCVAFDILLFLSLAAFLIFIVIQIPVISIVGSVNSISDLIKIIFLVTISILGISIGGLFFFTFMCGFFRIFLWLASFVFCDLFFLKFLQEEITLRSKAV
jgi:hypothetical protein